MPDPSTVLPHRSLVRLGVAIVLLGGLAGLHPADVAGQTFGRIEDTETNLAYFYYARPGEATIQVSVWGSVSQTGILEVPDTTDLHTLLTLAGGAPGIGKRRENRDPPEVIVRLYRKKQGERTKIFESEVEDVMTGAKAPPTLQENDVVMVETIEQRHFGFRDALSIASSIGSIILLALRLRDF